MVVVVGTISYIGLIVPNLVTIYKGDNLRNTILDTALAGALFVLICDLIGRVVIAPYELPIELISGCVGSVIFISLIFYRIRGSKAPALATIKKLLSSPPSSSCPCPASISQSSVEQSSYKVESLQEQKNKHEHEHEHEHERQLIHDAAASKHEPFMAKQRESLGSNKSSSLSSRKLTTEL